MVLVLLLMKGRCGKTQDFAAFVFQRLCQYENRKTGDAMSWFSKKEKHWLLPLSDNDKKAVSEEELDQAFVTNNFEPIAQRIIQSRRNEWLEELRSSGTKLPTGESFEIQDCGCVKFLHTNGMLCNFSFCSDACAQTWQHNEFEERAKAHREAYMKETGLDIILTKLLEIEQLLMKLAETK